MVAESDLRSVLDATRPLWEELRGERILITGATGFFGRWLLATFAFANRELGLKAEAVALSRRPPRESTDSSIRFVAADVRAIDTAQVPGHFAFTIHAAAAASAPAHAEDPLGTFATIVEGTRQVLELCEKAKTRRLLFLSSGAVYGRQPPELERLRETVVTGPDPCSPRSAYAEGKRAAELLCTLHARDGFTPVIARGFAFVGPGMPLDGPFAIGCFIRDALKGGPIRIEGDGTPLRTYLYASDLMTWLWTMLFRGRAAYNVGGEQILSIAELARTVAAVVRPEARVEIVGKPSPGKPERYVPAIDRARTELGLDVTVSLEEAIRRTAAWEARS